MKKRLFAILLALTLALTLLPVTAYAAADDGQSPETFRIECPECKTEQVLEIIGRVWKRDGYQVNEKQHWLHVLCPSCGKKGYIGGEDHTGGTETPTCTKGKTCEKCGGEYGKLGHIWGDWQSNGDNKTHIRTCQREGCNAVDTADCGGGAATCVTADTCTGCGGPYYGGHNFAKYWDSDANTHWYPCLNENCKAKKDEAVHWFAQGNMYLKSAATCISNAVYYTNCASCYYKGTDTYQWGQLDPTKHDGGTERKNAKAATCTEKGYTGDTHTRVCSRDKSHSENGKCSGGKADCCHKAKCEVCGGAYGSLAPDNHSDLKHFPAKRATTHAEGSIEYWYCSGCGKYYKDAGATKEITQKDTAIRKRRSSSGSTTGDKAIESPKTGDAGIVLYIGMAALSLTGGAWLRRKEQ